MKRSTKKALRIATAAVAGFGLLIGYLSYRNAQIARELDSEGVTTSAVIIGRHTEERTFHNRRRAPTQRQITRIEYEFTVDGKTYRNDVSGLSGSGALQRGDRVQIVFRRFAPGEARQIVKDAGFYWSPSLKCWQRRITKKAERAAYDVSCKLAALHLH